MLNTSTQQNEYGIALFDFAARESDEIDIRKGDKFTIIEKFDDGWWEVECDRTRGLIPSNYIKIINPNMNYEDDEIDQDQMGRHSKCNKPISCVNFVSTLIVFYL